jgi:uncharacterized membrane protein YccC
LLTHVTQATQVAAARPAYAAGLRAAIATVAPLVVGSALGWPNAAWMGLAGFNVALGDKGGLLRTRLGAMLPAAFYGALAAAIGAMAGRHPASAVVVFALWAIGAGVARTYGAAATGTGILSLATLVVSMEQPVQLMNQSVWAFDAALVRGGAVVGGAAFAIVISLLLGRFRLYAPARLAVARVYRLLAALAAGDAVPPEELRETVGAARGTLTQLRRGLQGESPRGERLLVLLESGDRMAALLARAPSPDPELTTLLRTIADTVEHERFDGTLTNPAAGMLRETLDAALTALRELQEVEPLQQTRPGFQAAYVEPIRGLLTRDSAVLRHALRVAVAGGIAVAFTRAFHVDRGYWLTLTVVVVLQPYTSATVQRGLQRVAGTVAGAIVAALLLSVVHTPMQMMAVVFVGAALTVATLPVNYGLFSFVLTPTFVMLAEVHAIDRHLVWLRVDNTLIGALLAWLAAWLLWPASERGRVRDDLAAALHALAELARCTAECDDTQVNEARRAFTVALNNAGASVQRVLSDPRAESGAPEEAMMAVLIYARRCAAALTELAEAADRTRLFTLATHASAQANEAAKAVIEERAPVVPEETSLRAESERLLESLTALHSSVARLADDGRGLPD